jgi:predicted ATPase
LLLPFGALLAPDEDGPPGGAEDPPALSCSPPAARFALFEAMTGFLVELAEARPLIVVLEDLQWADQFSLRLLEHIATRLSTSNVLVVFTCRSPENQVEVALTELLGALVRLQAFDWIELDGLNCPEVGRLMAQSGARVSSAQVTEIHARTDGNPFFVSNFARILATRDVSRPSLAGFIPSSVQAVIRRRLSRVPAPTRDLLVVAAAMGREFDLRKVATASQIPLGDALKWVQPAVLAGVVTEDMMNPGKYRFAHGLVREILRGETAGLCRCKLRALADGTVGDDPSERQDGADQQEACG